MHGITIGVVATISCFFAPMVSKFCGVDDRLDCANYHGIGGMVGALLTGLLASKDKGDSGVNGAFYGNSKLLGIQMLGVVVTFFYSVFMTSACYLLTTAVAGTFNSDVRVPLSQIDNLDAAEHGTGGQVPVSPAPTRQLGGIFHHHVHHTYKGKEDAHFHLGGSHGHGHGHHGHGHGHHGPQPGATHNSRETARRGDDGHM